MLIEILKFCVGAAIVGLIAVGTFMLPNSGLRTASEENGAEDALAASSEESQLMSSGLLELHERYVDQFAKTEDFGAERMPRLHHFSNLPTDWTAKDDGSHWQLKSYQLVGILKTAPPRVYMDNKPPKMLAESALMNTRVLDAFEANSLAELRAGKELVVDRSNPYRLRMLGSLRATGTCVNCHHEPEGSLLGALTYDLERVTPGS
jgi:hypothetical protein